MKTIIITAVAVVLAALTLTQTAQAASIFVHNENTPPGGATVSYTINDHTARYIYTFHRTVTLDKPDIELALPQQFQTFDSVSVTMHMSAPFELTVPTPRDELGDLGVDVWYDLSEPQ